MNKYNHSRSFRRKFQGENYVCGKSKKNRCGGNFNCGLCISGGGCPVNSSCRFAEA